MRPHSGFDDDRRPAMYDSDSLGDCIVKQLVRDAPWQWRQQVLPSFMVMFCSMSPLAILVQSLVIRIEQTNLGVRFEEPLATITSVKGLWMITTQ